MDKSQQPLFQALTVEETAKICGGDFGFLSPLGNILIPRETITTTTTPVQSSLSLDALIEPPKPVTTTQRGPANFDKATIDFPGLSMKSGKLYIGSLVIPLTGDGYR